jgi:hypothetical protein
MPEVKSKGSIGGRAEDGGEQYIKTSGIKNKPKK